MTGKKKLREKPPLPRRGMAEGMLMTALDRGDDFIVTFETDDDGQQLLHILAGKLITSCMLGTLVNRCGQPEHTESTHLVLKQE